MFRYGQVLIGEFSIYYYRELVIQNHSGNRGIVS
jgi:hypothetical protein